jgi:hypothetical protein
MADLGEMKKVGTSGSNWIPPNVPGERGLLGEILNGNGEIQGVAVSNLEGGHPDEITEVVEKSSSGRTFRDLRGCLNQPDIR